jgi:phosphomannomutase
VVNKEAIMKRDFLVIIDAVNSTGALALPVLLDRLQVRYQLINGEIHGRFAHNPEPLPEHLGELCDEVRSRGADLGIAVDPDVDRLALVAEDGSWFGEEYTLVLVADHVLSRTPGAVVSNLSSSRALRDLTHAYGQQYRAAAVGEVNVVRLMKETGAVIGGEGNGGVIYPELHYGRDALVGVAIALSRLAETGIPLSKLKKGYPIYEMSKDKVQLKEGMDVDAILEKVANSYSGANIDRTDGVKIDLPESWIHLRKSNTEPIIRIYTEAGTRAIALDLAKEVRELIQSLL